MKGQNGNNNEQSEYEQFMKDTQMIDFIVILGIVIVMVMVVSGM